MRSFALARLGAGSCSCSRSRSSPGRSSTSSPASPGANPAQRIAGKAASRAQIRRVAHQLGTDQPLSQQYGLFLWKLGHGNFGYSYQQRRPVSDIVFPAAKTTASLVVGAAIVWTLIAIPIGVVGALRPRSHCSTAG